MKKGFLLAKCAAALFAAAAAAGCRTRPVQKYAIDFINPEDGRTATVVFMYGDGSMHETPFTDARGQTSYFKSDKRCKVELSDGESFKAYQTLSGTGTLYVSDDAEWKCLSLGLYCVIARRSRDNDGTYQEYFTGQVTESERAAPERGKRRVQTGGGDASGTKSQTYTTRRYGSGSGASSK